MFNRRKKQVPDSVVDQRFDDMMNLIKDLPRADYNRMKKAMDLGYEARQTIKNVKSEDEKEVEDIEKIDKSLSKEAK